MNDYMVLRRLAVTAALAYGAFAAWAMPTKTELAQAQQLVQDLTAEDLRAMKAGTKKPGEVAAAQLAFADEAETEAGKYLLLQGAFKLYARSADYDAAADVLMRMRKEIVDLPPEVIVELVNGEMRRVAAEKAPKVLAIFRDAQRTMKCRKELAAAESAAKAKPDDKAVQRRLAECHVGMGDWPKALEIFAKVGDEAAKFEQDPASAKGFDAVKAANYWWEYAAKDAEPFKAHAAVLYKKGLEDGSITGLRKTLAEKRVNEMENAMMAAPAVANASAASDKAPNAAPAKRGKSIMVKIKKGVEIEFVPCPAGTFTMGHTSDPDDIEYKHEVTITRPFWMSKFPITVEQFDAFCPVDKDFQKKYGKQGESKSPACLQIGHVENYCKWLNRRFAFVLPHRCIFRLPTDAEWEYALFANSMDKDDPYVRFRDGEKAALREICGTNLPVTVGTAGKPNAWGIYDMLGNGCHYVLDTISGEYIHHGACFGSVEKKLKWGYKESEADPLRLYVPKDNKTKAHHLMRGARYVWWDRHVPHGPNVYYRQVECGLNRYAGPRMWTFRVVIAPDLLKERGIKLPNLGK